MENNPLPFAIRTAWVLRIFWIMPALLGLMILDIAWYNQTLIYPHMGLDSLYLPLYLLVFELPHIIGSFLSFADKEYITHYKRKLLLGLPIVLGGVGLLLYVNLIAAIVFYLVATMYHVIKQQTGIGLLLGAARGNWFTAWTWFGIVMTSFLYVFFLLPDLFPPPLFQIVNISTIVMLVAFIGCGSVVRLKSHNSIAKRYVLLTTLTLVFGYLFINIGYLFLAFFLIRFIHDVTAFYFYIAHETNRNHEQLHNVLYQSLRYIPLPIFILVPLISIGFGYVVRVGFTGEYTVYVTVIMFGFVHYYLESMIWKRDALHRQAIKVV